MQGKKEVRDVSTVPSDRRKTSERNNEKICPPDTAAMEQCQQRWDSIAKPLHSLGRLEEVLIQTAGMTGSDEVHFGKKALIVMCADNGVVEEGISQTGQEVTAVVAENFLSGDTSAAIMCKAAGADLFPVDIGIARDTKLRDEKLHNARKIWRGSGDDKSTGSLCDRNRNPYGRGTRRERI